MTVKTVKVRLAGHVRAYFPDRQEVDRVTVGEAADLNQVILETGVPPELIWKVLVNGRPVERGYVPADGDEIVLLSPMAGG